MCGDYAPITLKADPALGLPSQPGTARPLEHDLGHDKGVAKGDDRSFDHMAGQLTTVRPHAAESRYRTVPVEMFTGAIAQGMRTVPEQSIKLAQLIAGQASL